MTMRRTVQFPPAFEARIERLVALRGESLAAPARLAEAVLRLSDHYIEKPDAPTPWDQPWAQLAYACYFFPLNYLRVMGVLVEAQRVGFLAGLERYADFGSGVGTVPLALADAVPGQFRQGLAIERSAVPARMYRELAAGGGEPSLSWSLAAPRALPDAGPGHASFFSYALTELPALPQWALASDALVLIEPATSQDGRKLLALRQSLLERGYHVWAPCTHEGACPLLAQSGRDWCHDRVDWEQPAWFAELSEHLPMSNPTVTCSYLLMRRDPPPPALAGLGRLTGDLRREKGASRQMVCRGSEREFLSWQHKHGEPPEWPRGSLVRMQADIVKKSNELRLMAGQCDVVTDPLS